jgi:hypothetical protein
MLDHRANPKTIQDKFLVGYQGWCVQPSFRCNLGVFFRPSASVVVYLNVAVIRMDDGVSHVLRTHSFAGSPAMEMVNPSTLTTTDGCTGSINRSQMVDTPTQICGQIYPNTPHPSCIPPQVFKIKMANRCFYFLRATKRR